MEGVYECEKNKRERKDKLMNKDDSSLNILSILYSWY